MRTVSKGTDAALQCCQVQLLLTSLVLLFFPPNDALQEVNEVGSEENGEQRNREEDDRTDHAIARNRT